MSVLRKAETIRSRPRRRGPGLLVGIIVFVALLLGSLYVYLEWGGAAQKRRIASLEALAARLTAQTVPMRFMVLSRDAEGLRVRVRLYDLSGAELALVERSLPGAELYLDFILSPLPSLAGLAGAAEPRWLAFPYRVFTDRLPAAEGLSLVDAYDRSGFPAIYGGSAEGLRLGPGESAELSRVFARAPKSRAAAPSSEPGPGEPPIAVNQADFGSAVHDVAAFSRFEVGVVYKVVCRAKGGIEVMED